MHHTQESNPTVERIWKLIEETNRIIQEVAEQSRETDRKFQETDRQFQETKLMLQDVSRREGDLGNRLGEFVEHMVAPAVVRLFQEQGIEVHEVHQNYGTKRGGGMEIDLLVVDDGVLVAVECKSKLATEHVDKHLSRLGRLKECFPLYANHRVLGAVAAMVMGEEAQQYAQSQGLYVLCQSGEGVVVGNQPGFVPKTW
ncbi:hypothetical protein [Candidatus Symbiobacter mobilis]|uniref:DUF3782 domain-containing protein n=1 Tax=Candidatus Symbiobacter mobilis CR TaxID=946483 RepID=U5NCV1_9BURK|nr:hypothetical protein [Candidatus Symbiobacter mobilis]AGX88068.1 hypothetical protein Cenrod_1995 [Candidatus Symbiobacter mobilis CR]